MRVALVTVALLLTACADGGPGDAPPPGLRAALEQSRDNENRGLVQVVVTNDGDAPVRVRGVRLDSPGYEPVAVAPFDQEVRPGSRTAFPVDDGEAVCDGGTSGSGAVLALAEAEGTRQVRLAVPDDDPVLRRLHARACALQRIGDTVDIALTGARRAGPETVTLDLVVTRRAGRQAVRVTDLQSSIILTGRAPALPLVLAGSAARAATPVEVRAVRCEAHALIESKRTYTFPVFVGLGDAEPLQVPMTADAEAQAVLFEALRERCAANGITLQPPP